MCSTLKFLVPCKIECCVVSHGYERTKLAPYIIMFFLFHSLRKMELESNYAITGVRWRKLPAEPPVLLDRRFLLRQQNSFERFLSVLKGCHQQLGGWLLMVLVPLRRMRTANGHFALFVPCPGLADVKASTHVLQCEHRRVFSVSYFVKVTVWISWIQTDVKCKDKSDFVIWCKTFSNRQRCKKEALPTVLVPNICNWDRKSILTANFHVVGFPLLWAPCTWNRVFVLSPVFFRSLKWFSRSLFMVFDISATRCEHCFILFLECHQLLVARRPHYGRRMCGCGPHRVDNNFSFASGLLHLQNRAVFGPLMLV